MYPNHINMNIKKTSIISKKESLTSSEIERQNILNNQYALEIIRKQLDIEGILFDGVIRFTKQMVADFFEVSMGTINRYLSKYKEELGANGYKLFKVTPTNYRSFQVDLLKNEKIKTRRLGLFDFRSFLNMGMLLVGSEKARELRSVILDIVISTINERTGGGTKYINSRDINFIPAAAKEENYRRNFTSALSRYVDGHPTNMYKTVTDMVYVAIFREEANEYKKILRLGREDNERRTMYAEVLLAISSVENGVAYEIEQEYNKLRRKLSMDEVQNLINRLSNHPSEAPYLYDARTKMASRDLGLREAFHGNISEYLKALSPEEFDKFLGPESIDFDKILQLQENKDALRRLKQANN